MAAIIKGADELRRKLRKLGVDALPALGAPLLAKAEQIRAVAVATAPKGETGELAGSSFVSGPDLDKTHMSATVTTGFEADHAAYAHEGYHFGRKVENPPKFLERAAAGHEAALAEDIGGALMSALAATK